MYKHIRNVNYIFLKNWNNLKIFVKENYNNKLDRGRDNKV
jgi:hypothetical protein